MLAPAVILRELGRPPELEEVDIAGPGPGEVLVRLVASGVCHTDLSAVRDARACPVLLGHEGAGIVEARGEGVTHVAEGDPVVVNWQAKCHRCRRCREGREDLCESVRGTVEPRVFLKGRPLAVMLHAGTFCPWAVLPAEGAVPVPRAMPLDRAALLSCGVATGVGAVLHTAGVTPGDDVVVLGTGGVGLNVVQGARLAGARRIVAVDLDPGRLRLARDFGATEALSAGSVDPVEAVLDLTGGRGVEHVFEVVGLAEAMRSGIDMLARGGILTLVGAAARDAALTFAPRRFMSRQQQIRGSIYGNVRPMRDLPWLADLYLRGDLLLDPLIGDTMPLSEVPALFTGAVRPGGVRPMIGFGAAA